MDMKRLERQIEFLVEIDKAKNVLRRSLLTDGSRRENDAEHSWHLAVMALVLGEYADQSIDIARVVKMLLIHDIVEIDAGDAFAYDEAARLESAKREKKAAQRIFGMLPEDQAAEFRALWEEFERRETPDARFAAALDRLHPLLQNYHSRGISWRQHGITRQQAIDVNNSIALGSQKLWEYARALIDRAEAEGLFNSPDRRGSV